MKYQYMSDDLILEHIARSIEEKRIQKGIKSADLAKMGGFSAQTYSNFVNRHADIKLGTLIQIMRALDELDKLEEIFTPKESNVRWGRFSTGTRRRVRRTPLGGGYKAHIVEPTKLSFGTSVLPASIETIKASPLKKGKFNIGYYNGKLPAGKAGIEVVSMKGISLKTPKTNKFNKGIAARRNTAPLSALLEKFNSEEKSI